MPGSSPEDYLDALGVEPSLASGAPRGLREQLETLFIEVNGLANLLKKATTSMHRRYRLPAGGRSLMQILSDHGPQTVPQIAGLSLSSRQNIQVGVNRLRVEGWVELATNPTHKRSKLVSLTKLGESMVATAREREDELWKKLSFHGFPARADAAIALLRQIRELLADTKPPRREIVGEPKIRRRTKKVRVPGISGGAVLQATEPRPTLPAAWEGQPGEDEFPINLL